MAELKKFDVKDTHGEIIYHRAQLQKREWMGRTIGKRDKELDVSLATRLHIGDSMCSVGESSRA